MLQSFGFIIELGIVGIILFFQIRFFLTNKKKRNILASIFPKNIENHFKASQDEDGVAQITIEDYDNSILDDEIVEPINAYLRKNKGATDYHIIKDLTDRSCNKIQEEVDLYNPIPLYLGLCGTMLGIIVGIFFLWFGGGLDSLLASSSEFTINNDTSASQGIQHLLGGVALAMIASFVGVFMTIIGTKWTKTAVADNEDGRNRFLSWIQCNLLPKMSSDVVSTLGIFYSNLNNFNSIFSENSKELKKAFEQIQMAYQEQTEYTKELNKLDIDKAQLAFASLGAATQRINELNTFLKDSSSYISRIIELNDKLDATDARTKAIEEMGTFFKNEIEQIKLRKSLLSESVGKIDLALTEAMSGLQISTKEHIGKLQEYLAKVYIDFQDATSYQQKLLIEKLSESSDFLTQFNRLEAIENKLVKLDRLDDLVAAVTFLGERLNALQTTIKDTGAPLKGLIGNSTTLVSDDTRGKDVKVEVKMPMPTWLLYVTCAMLIAASFFTIIFLIIVGI